MKKSLAQIFFGLLITLTFLGLSASSLSTTYAATYNCQLRADNYCDVQPGTCTPSPNPCLPRSPSTCASGTYTCDDGTPTPTPTPEPETTPTNNVEGEEAGEVEIKLPEGKDEIDIGFITLPTNPTALATVLLRVGIGIGTLLSILLIVVGGYGVATSTGDPDKLQKARAQITAAISGLVFLLISTVILHIIGIRIIGISPDIFPF